MASLIKVNLCLVSLILLSCSSISQKKYEAKSDLIKPYSYRDQKKEPFKAPYIAQYGDNNKMLWYIAADHSDDINSSTFKTIEYAFAAFHPEVVIVEGFEYTGVFSPKWYIKRCSEAALEKFKRSSESCYATLLAVQSSIDFVPAEPTDESIATLLQEKNYSADDYAYFELARIANQWKRQGVIKNDKDFSKNSYRYMQKEDYHYKNFLKWYKVKAHKKFSVQGIHNEDFSPQIDDHPTFFNKMAHEVGMIRERHILKIMEMLINRYSRVLVVYGSGHLVKERAVLEDLFGTPKNIKKY